MSAQPQKPTSSQGPSSWTHESNANDHATSERMSDGPRRDVTVRLQYLKDLPLYKTVKPLQITPNFQDSEGRTNVVLEAGPEETIRDIRGIDPPFDLDRNGFKFVKAGTSFTNWSSQPEIAAHYLQEMETLLYQEVQEVDEVLFYDARIRQSGDEGLRVEGLSFNPFAKQVHRDNTDVSCVEKIRNLTDLKADFLLRGRSRIINIWRPIKHPVYDCSLAVADGSNLRADDVIECDRHLARTGAYHDTIGVVKYRPGFDWNYCSEMEPDDVLLFKNYDSSTAVQARCCLHTAFDLPAEMIPTNAPTRESIEVRALVFTYPAGQRRPSTVASLSSHPLARTLAKGELKRLDDEHSITDRIRTDIDEAGEVKDAVLLLRKQEIKRLEQVCEEQGQLLQRAKLDRDNAFAYTEKLQRQIGIQTGRIESLEAELRHVRHQLSQSSSELRCQLSQTQLGLVDARRECLEHHLERKRLLEFVRGQEGHIQRRKDEAMGRGDEAVKRERQKDEWPIRNLQEEISRLQSKDSTLMSCAESGEADREKRMLEP
ncbi:hypothetical protein KC332_g8643 [Hortaea werneckii]|uniref:Uncharacterized protein n=2 Tax=Hortaea werneckii TaxID=91943 RepID=A0A3M7JAE5_HORWE|nr:hypothetical protein KC358_g8473 [Hortaea werneckii]KAI6829218.1 hypothetical protein KC350_g7907 [Hortaea werneckii]KAI6925795.1 hypothetical protein KC348_g8878 [Hortaea werneckii]KAI6933326.1 hypothetical protein KC341_g8361 [Hortaea werneckii]KAI6967924.1 hypothetical protein KC321_g8752 [Hortaea werneckii]